jgi:hypothetical protein
MYNLNTPSVINESLLGKLKQVNGGLDNNLKALLNDYHLTSENCSMLLVLNKQPDGMCSYTQLLQTEIVDEVHLATCMKRLADKGYIKLTARKDTGEKLLQLTTRGFKMAEQLSGFELLLNDSFAGLNQMEKRQLLTLLNKVQQPVVFSLV